MVMIMKSLLISFEDRVLESPALFWELSNEIPAAETTGMKSQTSLDYVYLIGVRYEQL